MAAHEMTSRSETEGNGSASLGTAVSEIKAAVTGKAEELAGRSAHVGAETVAAVGRSAESLAGSLQDQSPAVAAYVRSTGQRIDRLADDLRDKPAGELLAMATDFGKRQPLALLAGAAIIGFALARVVKAGIGASGSEPGPGSRTANEGRIDVGGTS